MSRECGISRSAPITIQASTHQPLSQRYPFVPRRFDKKLESWKTGFVKMTMDLPEDLLRELKIRAVTEGKTFKSLMTELFRKGLAIMEEQNEAKAKPVRKIRLK